MVRAIMMSVVRGFGLLDLTGTVPTGYPDTRSILKIVRGGGYYLIHTRVPVLEYDSK